jgi:hypothetical protein
VGFLAVVPAEARRADQGSAHDGTSGRSAVALATDLASRRGGVHPSVTRYGPGGCHAVGHRPASNHHANRAQEHRMKQMIWETPSFVELRMDAEIGSYQDDSDPTREDPAFVAAEEEASR